MKSRARRTIEKWEAKQERGPRYLSEGSVFLWPSSGTDVFGPQHYLVAWMRRETKKGKMIEEFACACRGFYFNGKDECRHILELKRQIAKGGGAAKGVA